MKPTPGCWCGVTNPEFSDDIPATCDGAGYLTCRCGGEFCVCHWHGEVECYGCSDCEPDDDDLDDFGREAIQPGDHRYYTPQDGA